MPLRLCHGDLGFGLGRPFAPSTQACLPCDRKGLCRSSHGSTNDTGRPSCNEEQYDDGILAISPSEYRAMTLEPKCNSQYETTLTTDHETNLVESSHVAQVGFYFFEVQSGFVDFNGHLFDSSSLSVEKDNMIRFVTIKLRDD